MAQYVLKRMRSTRLAFSTARTSLSLRELHFAPSILFTPVLYQASINKSSASHSNSVRVRNLRPSQAASLFILPPSLFLSFPFTHPAHSRAVAFLHLLFRERQTVAKSILMPNLLSIFSVAPVIFDLLFSWLVVINKVFPLFC